MHHLKQKLIRESLAFQPILVAYLPANLPKKEVVYNPSVESLNTEVRSISEMCILHKSIKFLFNFIVNVWEKNIFVL